MYTYEYDTDMIREMEIIMENSEEFYDGVRIVRDVYFDRKSHIDPFTIRAFNSHIIAHAANYCMPIFQIVWSIYECSDYFLRAEYFKACHNVIPELMETCEEL